MKSIFQQIQSLHPDLTVVMNSVFVPRHIKIAVIDNDETCFTHSLAIHNNAIVPNKRTRRSQDF